MAQKYTRSKVLYLASLGKPLNVAIKERKDTDLNLIVADYLSHRLLKEVGRDDCDIYYKLTVAGRVRHLKNRIMQRKEMGKCTLEQEQQLTSALKLANKGEHHA